MTTFDGSPHADRGPAAVHEASAGEGGSDAAHGRTAGRIREHSGRARKSIVRMAMDG